MIGEVKRSGFLLFLLLLLFLVLVSFPQIEMVKAEEDYWVSKTPMNEARWGLSVVVVNDKIYAIGGSTQKGAPPYTGGVVGTNEVYDPATDTWETKAPMPTPRDHFGITVNQNRIYCIGGHIGYEYTAANEVYDPITDKWENKTPAPVAKAGKAISIGDKIYFIGGNPNNTLNQVYDPITDLWTTKAPMPAEAHGVSIAIADKIYVIGGSYSGSQFYTLTQVYFPESDTWIQGASPPSGGVSKGIATIGDMAPRQIYIVDEALRVYDPESDTWTYGTKMPIERLNFGLVVVNDMLYTIGGNTYTYPDPMHSIGEDPIITIYATTEQYRPFGYIPELPSWTIVPLFLIATVVAIICRNRL